MRKLFRLALVFVAALLALSACGSDDAADTSADESTVEEDTADESDESTADEADAEFPRIVSTAAGDVTVAARPAKIVSLSATATEMLFAMGAGEQVAAVDSYSDYPAEAPTTDLAAFEANIEAIVGYEPDLVVMSFSVPDVEQGLADLAVPVLMLPSALTIDDTYDQIAQLGEATGNIDGAAGLNADIRAGIDEILASAPKSDEPIRVYHELDDTFFSASSSSFIGHLYDLLGYENIADVADPENTGFPQMQAEQIIDGDPNLIVFTDAYSYGPDELAARPGWDALSAVVQGNVVQVDDDISSRWGPRIVEFLQVIVDTVATPVSG